MTEDVRVCPGCGVELQTEDEHKPGYVPESALGREDVVCRRCFRITHYNEVSRVEMDEDDFLEIIHKIGQDDALIIKVVDIFDFDGSWLDGITRFAGHNPVLLVGNKVDLLPKNINLNRVENWMRHAAGQLGLKPVDVVLVSAKNGTGIEELVSKLAAYRRDKNVYVVGATNVGKSSLINRLLHDYGEGDQGITTSRFPGTTLDMIHIPLDTGSSIIDTPGIINREQITHILSPESLKIISPESTINPRVYQLNAGQTLFLGGLARIDFLRGDRQPFVIYASNRLYIHRTKTEKADELYNKQLGDLLVPPAPDEIERMPEMQRSHFKIKPGQKKDLIISGLGWVAFRETGCLLDVYAPKGVGVGLRKRLI
ncbi:MAG: ribosome biogenesis GTPase YqeH [Bacillaceae bacterium]|nr:ribosome biogenesis GTPase YqeH [Bacillaceae bacterium]